MSSKKTSSEEFRLRVTPAQRLEPHVPLELESDDYQSGSSLTQVLISNWNILLT